MVYLDRARAQGPLASATPGRPQMFTAQFRFQIEGDPFIPYPVGLWTLDGDGLTARRGGAANFVAMRYDAPQVGAVLGTPPSRAVRAWLLVDEHWLRPEQLGRDARLDSRGASYVLVSAHRLYDLCRSSPGRHVIKISPEVPGLTVHAMSFEREAPAP